MENAVRTAPDCITVRAALSSPTYRRPVRAVPDAMFRTLDAARAERSLSLAVHPQGGGHYRVTGGEEAHEVNLRDVMVPLCDCGDHAWRNKMCKHIVAALVVLGDPRALGFMLGLQAAKNAINNAN
jgi:hypothetical protein